MDRGIGLLSGEPNAPSEQKSLEVRRSPCEDRVDRPRAVVVSALGERKLCHPLPGGDDCLVLSLPTEDLLDILAERDGAARDRAWAPFLLTHAPCTPRASVLQS